MTLPITFPIKQIQKHTFPIKQLQGKYCLTPFILININVSGQVGLCGCSWWMSKTVGNIFTSTLDEILSSPEAVDVRRSIIDGTYIYCNEKVCGVIENDGLNTVDTLPPNVARLIENPERYDLPYHIVLNLDETCNLSCPSCRTKVIKVPDEEKEKQREVGRIVSKNLFSKPTDQKIVIEISSNEIFASDMLMELLVNIDTDSFPNLEIHLGTNATLIVKRWDRLKKVEHFIKKITVSVDAGSAEVYEKVRRGGKWKDLCAGMEFLKIKKKETQCAVHGRLIFQKENYKDSEKYYELCKQWEVDLIEYSRIYNWNTWTLNEFLLQDVYDPNHAEYNQAKEIVIELKKLPNTWFNGF
jgi:molybdenum cofactor biosynthesis enzyme MoaA